MTFQCGKLHWQNQGALQGVHRGQNQFQKGGLYAKRVPELAKARYNTSLRTITLCCSTKVDLEERWEILINYPSVKAEGVVQPKTPSPEERHGLREAVKAASQNPWPPASYIPPPDKSRQICMFISALKGEAHLAVRALNNYTHALGMPFKLPVIRGVSHGRVADMPGPVNIGYKAFRGLEPECYTYGYGGTERGVQLFLGKQRLGYLPLDLFDDAMTTARAPPKAGKEAITTAPPPEAYKEVQAVQQQVAHAAGSNGAHPDKAAAPAPQWSNQADDSNQEEAKVQQKAAQGKLSDLTVAELKSFLKGRKLTVSGRKAELVARVEESLASVA